MSIHQHASCTTLWSDHTPSSLKNPLHYVKYATSTWKKKPYIWSNRLLPFINADVNHSVSFQAEQKSKTSVPVGLHVCHVLFCDVCCICSSLHVSALKPTISCRLQLQRQKCQSEPAKCREQEVSSEFVACTLCSGRRLTGGGAIVKAFFLALLWKAQRASPV